MTIAVKIKISGLNTNRHAALIGRYRQIVGKLKNKFDVSYKKGCLF